MGMSVFRTLLSIALATAGSVLAVVSATAGEERTTSNLNLRTGPGMHYPVHVVIPAGSLVDVVSCGHEWCHLKWGGQVGYSHAGWLVSHVKVAVPIKHVK
jgi:uncharacterized protein YraI